ncbi:unnamed protein product [Cladocopium goreaui]|uniref:Uncharacterized protein n=1 Tax=Cladocopium goreaui TaxID=2562237 RepID=A0A9P1BSI0_9DINO|nr:unnamed protein product [Cladocopium goreaui]CAI3981492.1 unnamed protein product [Cladocopium goreaui]
MDAVANLPPDVFRSGDTTPRSKSRSRSPLRPAPVQQSVRPASSARSSAAGEDDLVFLDYLDEGMPSPMRVEDSPHTRKRKSAWVVPKHMVRNPR